MPSATAPSFQELFDLGRAEAALRRPDLTFDEGDISEMILAGETAMADHTAAYAAARFKATTVDGATGDDLRALADDHWKLQADEATFARGTAHLERSNAAAGAGTILAGAIVATARDSQGVDVRFALDAAAVFGATDLEKDVTVTAVVAGPAGNIAAGALSRFIETPFDPIIEVSNVAVFAGGNDAQDDVSLREDIRHFPDALRRATLQAIETGAKTVEGVAVAIAVDELVGGVETGITNLYVADADGNGTDVMVSSVRAIMKAWKAHGSILNIIKGAREAAPIEIELTLAAGLADDTVAALLDRIRAAIIAEVNKLRTGEKLYHARIIAAVRNTDPAAIEDVTVSSPANGALPTQAYNTVRVEDTDIAVTIA